LAKDQFIVDSDGELVAYSDTYGDVTDDQVAYADKVQTMIIDRANQIKTNYLVIGTLLNKFKEDQLYLAKGFPSFQAWCNGPDVPDMSYRTAQRLIQIVTEALPIFEKHDATPLAQEIGIATMADLLPILSDANGEEKFIEAAYKVKDLTNRDAKEEIKSIRGIGSFHDDAMPTVFSARMQRGESFHTVKIIANDGVDYYDVGTLKIRPKDWPRWSERFGRFLEIVS